MKLILAEDDLDMGRALTKSLMGSGHSVDWVLTGGALFERVSASPCDCVILDLGLPDISGSDCLLRLRLHNDLTPVVVLTAEGDRDTRIELLDMGADDFLVKPVDLDEVHARLGAVVRRSRSREAETELGLTFGPYTLVRSSISLLLDGQSIPLTPKEYSLLEVLMRNGNRVVTWNQLERVLNSWGRVSRGNAIEVHMHNLRRKLPADRIVTVRGVGYQLKLP